MAKYVVAAINFEKSHLTQVSGLKYNDIQQAQTCYRVSPYTGEWIEISGPMTTGVAKATSHLTQVSGLK